jgi:hypothetical protein
MPKATNSFVGRWKLNIAKSKTSPVLLAVMKEAAPKEQVNTVRILDAAQFELTIKGTRTDASPISVKATFPRQGGVLKPLTPIPEGTSYIVTMFDPGNWFFADLQNGKQVTVVNIVLSKDGKTIYETTKAADAQGKPVEQLHVFDRQ